MIVLWTGGGGGEGVGAPAQGVTQPPVAVHPVHKQKTMKSLQLSLSKRQERQ